MGSGTRDAVAVRHRHGRLSLVMGGPWRAAWRVARAISVALVAAVVTAAMVPAPAAASISGCPEANPTYFDACGPTFTQPAWGDAGGWTDPSKYSTIQLADLNGDGKDELIARNDQGLEIYWFDTSVGQWRPQVDANGVQQVLTDFASPAPGTTPATDWTKPEYYSTIQTAHIDGNANAQVLARFADGMHVYYFPARARRQHQRRYVVADQPRWTVQRRRGMERPVSVRDHHDRQRERGRAGHDRSDRPRPGRAGGIRLGRVGLVGVAAGAERGERVV